MQMDRQDGGRAGRVTFCRAKWKDVGQRQRLGRVGEVCVETMADEEGEGADGGEDEYREQETATCRSCDSEALRKQRR